MVLKKGFPGASRSSVRKDLGLVLKKARANNKKKKQEHRQLCQASRRGGGSRGSNEPPLEVNNGGLKTQTVEF